LNAAIIGVIVVDDVDVEHCRHSHKRSSFMALFGSSNTFDPMGTYTIFTAQLLLSICGSGLMSSSIL